MASIVLPESDQVERVVLLIAVSSSQDVTSVDQAPATIKPVIVPLKVG